MIKYWSIALAVVLALSITPSAQGQSNYPSRNDSFINDYAGLLTPTDASAVRALLSDLKVAHSIEAVIVTIKSIGDYATSDTTIESFATGLFNTWGIGDATRNDGVLLLAAVNDHKVRIELGSSYGSAHSNEMQAVIDRYVLPKFREDAYSAGILLGTQAMIAKLTDQPMPEIGDLPPTRVPSVSTNTTKPSTQTKSDSSWVIWLVLLGVILSFYGIGKALGGGVSSNQDDDDGDNRHSSLWSRRSSSSSSYRSNSSSSSSNDSSKGGGRSSGGGASGSW